MKKPTLIISVFILGATSLIYALQNTTKEKIIQGFNTGDADLIASFCDKESLLELFDSKEYEGQSAIRDQLKTFFAQYPPRSFKVRHESGKNHSNKDYLVGVLHCEEEVFRITLAINHKIMTSISIIFAPPIG